MKRHIQRLRISEIVYDNQSLRLFYRMLSNEEMIYEKEIFLIQKLIKPGDLVADIGANRGEYSYFFSKLVGDDGCVYSFEPGSRARHILQKIIEKSKLDNVRLIPMALSDSEGETELIVPYFNRQSQINSNKPIKGRRERVPLNTLDNFARSENLKRLDFIKCDTEGAEMLVFKGSVRVISEFQPVVMVEIAEPHLTRFGFKVEEVRDFFISRNYMMYTFDFPMQKLIEAKEIVLKAEGHVWSGKHENLENNNYIFIPQTKLNLVKDFLA
ncbi:MAG: FkbM family methyltransferase [Bacteroidales bacterium]